MDIASIKSRADLNLWQSGVPLWSGGSARIFLTEWGPWFIDGLALATTDRRRRVIVTLFLMGLVVACLLRAGVNPSVPLSRKADMDRFLFYGTCAGFMLTAIWVEKLEAALGRGSISRGMFRGLTLSLIVIPTVIGPFGYMTRFYLGYLRTLGQKTFSRSQSVEAARLRAALSAVGPRDLVETDQRYAEELVLAGFIVASQPGGPRRGRATNHSGYFDVPLLNARGGGTHSEEATAPRMALPPRG